MKSIKDINKPKLYIIREFSLFLECPSYKMKHKGYIKKMKSIEDIDKPKLYIIREFSLLLECPPKQNNFLH